MKYYLAGPMTNRPQFNYPLFDLASTLLRRQGYDVTSPAEMDEPHVREAALLSKDGSSKDFGKVLELAGREQETWGDFLARDVKLIADELNAIILLPGWQTSKGARLEAFVAINLNYPAYLYNIHPDGFELTKVTSEYVMEQINANI